jgi:P pilus assembly chaperone PapD
MPVSSVRAFASLVVLAFASLLPIGAAHAELVLSELIVELQPGKQTRDDIEVWNDSPERAFVAVEPREILDPSRASQTARKNPDPQKLGLLVSPARMILEPGQRKLLRIATLGAASGRERVYRVTVKPVVGAVEAEASGLKLLVGYDVLVLVRPVQADARVTAHREGRTLTFSNTGNVSVEIVDGRQCDDNHAHCLDLPGKRLYPAASWTVDLQSDQPAEYSLRSPGQTDRRIFGSN